MLPRIPDLHLRHNDQPDRPLRLMSAVRALLRERHYSRRTEETYVHWIVRFIRFNDRRHPKDMGIEEVRRFLSDLAVEGQVSDHSRIPRSRRSNGISAERRTPIATISGSASTRPG